MAMALPNGQGTIAQIMRLHLPLSTSTDTGKYGGAEMASQTQHGLFYMENAGGYKPAEPETAPAIVADEHSPGCFALEEEKGERWEGSGATKPSINEARPSL